MPRYIFTVQTEIDAIDERAARNRALVLAEHIFNHDFVVAMIGENVKEGELEDSPPADVRL